MGHPDCHLRCGRRAGGPNGRILRAQFRDGRYMWRTRIKVPQLGPTEVELPTSGMVGGRPRDNYTETCIWAERIPRQKIKSRRLGRTVRKIAKTFADFF